MLGNLASPPLIQFDNFSWSAHRPIKLKVMAAQEGKEFRDTFSQLSKELEVRVTRFHAADKAVSLGLSPDASEVAAGSKR